MAALPTVLVPAPTVTPSRFGLFSAADVQPSTDRHIELGVHYEPLTFGAAYTLGDPCAGGDGTPIEIPEGVDEITGTPFHVYAGFRGKLVGRSQADVEARARAALALGEQRAVERALWTGSEGNRPRLADPTTTVVKAGAVSAKAGVALLEGWLGDTYPGEGVIHASRLAATHLDSVRDGARLTTKLGTRLAAGAGYLVNTGPDGSPAADGTAWLYATGVVGIWRGEAFLSPQGLRLNRITNEVTLLVARTYSVTVDGPVAAQLITVPTADVDLQETP